MAAGSDAGAVLRADIARAAEAVAVLDGQLAAFTRARAAESSDDEHDPEGVPLSAEWSRLEGLRAERRAEEERLRAAWERFQAGAYGVCEDCGRPIPAARLRARPEATRCVACAEKAGL